MPRKTKQNIKKKKQQIKENNDKRRSVFIIEINDKNEIKCIIEDDNGKQNNIKLSNQRNNYLPITISFTMNQIIIGEENENTIYFMNDLLDHQEEFIYYTIEYQEKEYSLIGEVLFSIIINEFKKIIEKKYIISKTEIIVPSMNNLFINRIKTALKAIGLKGIEIPDELDKENELLYRKQGDILFELLEKYSDYLKQKSMLERAQKITDSEEIRNQLIFGNTKPLTEQTRKEFCYKFSTKQKEQLKLYDLDNYCIFLASKYLNTIDDHINLIQVCKRLRFNMEKFHFNPVSLNKITKEFFPNVETIYLYGVDDWKYLKNVKGISKTIDLCLYNTITYTERFLLEEWTSLKFGEKIFDSYKDDWDIQTSVLVEKIYEKENLLFLIEDESGEVFGYFRDRKIDGNVRDNRKVGGLYFSWFMGKDSFEFHLRSNTRSTKPTKYGCENPGEYYGGILFYTRKNEILIRLGNILLMKKSVKEQSCCFGNECPDEDDDEITLNYLCGKEIEYDENDLSYFASFVPKRILVIQMK